MPIVEMMNTPILAAITTSSGQNYWKDGIIVVVLAGLALFAVCRAGRRQ